MLVARLFLCLKVSYNGTKIIDVLLNGTCGGEDLRLSALSITLILIFDRKELI